MIELDVQSLILIYLTSLPKSHFYRVNTGVFPDSDGVRRIRTCPKGTPDIKGTLNGRSVVVEAKRSKGGKHAEDQKNWQRNHERAGGLYILANSVDAVKNALRDEGLV